MSFLTSIARPFFGRAQSQKDAPLGKSYTCVLSRPTVVGIISLIYFIVIFFTVF